MSGSQPVKTGLFQASLRRQLIFLVTLIVVLSTAFFAFFNSRLQRELIVQEYANSTNVFLEALKLGLEIGLKEENYESINTVLAWGLENENIEFIVLTEASGEILASYPTELDLTLEQVKAIPAVIDLKNPNFVKTTSWFSTLSGDGMIYVGFKTQYLREIEQKALINLVLIILAVIFGSYISSLLLARSITRPLELLKAVTQKIASNELDNRADEGSGSQEIRVVASSFNQMIDKLLDSQQERLNAMQEFNSSLEERNVKLSEAYTTLEVQRDEIKLEKERTEQALEELKNTQLQLIQSEKMASLGNLIAGIAHEINTPAGAINSAINEIEKDYVVMLEQLVSIVNALPHDLQSLYLVACSDIIDFEKDISTKDQREIAREIQKILDDAEIENARYLSKNLAQIGFKHDMIAKYATLFNSEKADAIVTSFHQLGMSQIQVRDVKIAISRITQLVKALKSYSHLDNEVLAFTNMSEDLDNTLIILHNKIKRAITVKKEYEPLPQVKCYPDKLNQVWTNLIHNSIQAMKGEGQIILRLKHSGQNEICVQVEDNGPGIPADVLPRIFEPYFTTKSKGEGTGLGLSISVDIVKKHNGRIEVDSVPGRTCFSVYLPILNELDSEKESTQPLGSLKS